MENCDLLNSYIDQQLRTLGKNFCDDYYECLQIVNEGSENEVLKSSLMDDLKLCLYWYSQTYNCEESEIFKKFSPEIEDFYWNYQTGDFTEDELRSIGKNLYKVMTNILKDFVDSISGKPLGEWVVDFFHDVILSRQLVTGESYDEVLDRFNEDYRYFGFDWKTVFDPKKVV